MLPLEIIEIIFLKVKDKNTLLSIRLTDKYFYNIFKDVIDYDKGKKYVFINNSFQKFNLKTKQLEKEIVFKYPCNYIYKEYSINKTVTKEIKSSLFEMEKTDYMLYRGFKRKKYNIYDDTSSETITNYPFVNCSIM